MFVFNSKRYIKKIITARHVCELSAGFVGSIWQYCFLTAGQNEICMARAIFKVPFLLLKAGFLEEDPFQSAVFESSQEPTAVLIILVLLPLVFSW